MFDCLARSGKPLLPCGDERLFRALPAKKGALKKSMHLEGGDLTMSRGGANSRRQKRRWVLRSRRGTELSRSKGIIVLNFSSHPQVVGVAWRKSD